MLEIFFPLKKGDFGEFYKYIILNLSNFVVNVAWDFCSGPPRGDCEQCGTSF